MKGSSHLEDFAGFCEAVAGDGDAAFDGRAAPELERSKDACLSSYVVGYYIARRLTENKEISELFFSAFWG
jgi:hypothetical protein